MRRSSSAQPTVDVQRIVWSASWSLNYVELPLSLPAPVHSPHENCRKAARLVRKHSKARVDDEHKHMLLHWALADYGLVVQGGDDLKLLIKGSYTPVGGAARRFLTKERSVHIQRSASGMTKLLKGGEVIDVHQTGDYLLELLTIDTEDDGDLGGGGGGCLTYQVVSLTLRFDYPEVASAVAASSTGPVDATATTKGSAKGGSKGSGGGKGGSGGGSTLIESAAVPSPIRPDTVRNLDTGEVYHVSEVEERVSLGVQPSSLRAISRHTPTRTSPAGGGLLGSLLSSIGLCVRVRVRVRVRWRSPRLPPLVDWAVRQG